MPSQSGPAVLGSVQVGAVRATDDNRLFEAKPRARLWTTHRPAPIGWELSFDSATAVRVPVGAYTLSAFAVYLSDTIVCADNTNGAPGQTCLQPTLGPSLTCDLPVVVTEGRTIEATFELLAEGRCRLDFGLPSALTDEAPSAEPAGEPSAGSSMP